MNPTDKSLDDFLTAHTGQGLIVTLSNGQRLTGTTTRGAAYNAGTADVMLLIVDETVSRAFSTPVTRRWFLDVADVVSVTA